MASCQKTCRSYLLHFYTPVQINEKNERCNDSYKNFCGKFYSEIWNSLPQYKLTKFVEACPLKTKDAITVAKTFVGNFTRRHGIPCEIATRRYKIYINMSSSWSALPLTNWCLGRVCIIPSNIINIVESYELANTKIKDWNA